MTLSCKRLVLVSLCACFLAGAPAMASGGGGGHGGSGKADAQAENKSKRKEIASITGGQFEGDPVYLHLAPVTLPVINDYGAQQIVTMLIDFQTKDRAAAESIQVQMPRVKDAIMQALYGSLADGSVRNGHALDIPKIKAQIQSTVDRVFEEGSVKEVLIQGVSQKKL